MADIDLIHFYDGDPPHKDAKSYYGVKAACCVEGEEVPYHMTISNNPPQAEINARPDEYCPDCFIR